MQDLIAFVVQIDGLSTLAMVLITLLSVTITRAQTEFTIVSSVVTFASVIMVDIRDPVLVTVNKWMEYEQYRTIAISSWYVLWSVIQIGIIYLSKSLCRFYHIPRTNTFRLFALMFCVLTIIQIVGCIDQLYIQSDFIDSAYRYLVVTLYTVVAMMLFTEFLRVPLFDRRDYFRRAVTSLSTAVKAR